MLRDPGSVLTGLYAEVVNAGNLDAVEEFLAPEYVEHPEEVRGREAFKERMRGFRAAFPDLHVTVEEVLVAGDKASSRTRITGTQTNELMGIPPTGRKIDVLAVDLTHFENGRAVERWGGLDMYSLLTQLGVIPHPQQAGV